MGVEENAIVLSIIAIKFQETALGIVWITGCSRTVKQVSEIGNNIISYHNNFINIFYKISYKGFVCNIAMCQRIIWNKAIFILQKEITSDNKNIKPYYAKRNNFWWHKIIHSNKLGQTQICLSYSLTTGLSWRSHIFTYSICSQVHTDVFMIKKD